MTASVGSSNRSIEELRPSIFISCAWDDEAHREAVEHLGRRLQDDGFAVRLDRWHCDGVDITGFMGEEVKLATRILICASPLYKRNVYRTEAGGVHGSDWEARLIAAALFNREKRRDQIVLAVVRGSRQDAVPDFVSDWSLINLTQNFDSNYAMLVERLSGKQPTQYPETAGQVAASTVDQFGTCMDSRKSSLMS